MGSFQISLTPTRRVASRFISLVRRSLLKALMEEGEKSGLTQTDVAKTIGVHRSVINRELRGVKDITLGRVAELAFSMGREIEFALVEPKEEIGRNSPKIVVEPKSSLESIRQPTNQGGVPHVSTKRSSLIAA